MMPNIDLYVVHLVRDIHALVWASSNVCHQNLWHEIEGDVSEKSNPRFCFDWLKENLLPSRVQCQSPANRPVFVFYENFVTDSRSVLRRIGEVLQMDCDDITYAIEDGRPLEVILHRKTK